MFVSTFSCGSSFGILAVISYDRYLHLSKLNNYNKHMTSKKCTALVFVYHVLTGSLVFQNGTKKLFYYCNIVSIAVCNVTICSCYCKAWKIVKCKTMPTTNTTMKKHWKAVKSMSLLVLFSIGSWLPLSFYGITISTIYQVTYIDFKSPYFSENGIIFLFCLWFGYVNSCINPVLYYWRNCKIRRGMKRLIIGKLC